MKKNIFYASAILLLWLSESIVAKGQTCYPTIIVGSANDTTTLAYDNNNHITSITDPFVIYLVKTNPNGSISEVATGLPGADEFYKATYTYDSRNNLIQYEAHKGANAELYWLHKFTYNATNQVIESNDGQYIKTFSYPNMTTKNPSRISIYLGDPKRGVLKQTAFLTYDNKKRMTYCDIPQYYLSPFATNNVVSIETSVDFFIRTGKFSYTYNAVGYPTSVSFAGKIHTDKDGNTDQEAYTQLYTYYCK